MNSATRKGCIFYQPTAVGWRCVLASPEEWRAFLANGRKPRCRYGSDPCPFLGRVRKDGQFRGLVGEGG